MVTKDFCTNWRCFQTGDREQAFDVTIPHDAMLLDSRSENSPGGVNTGWYDARDYSYEKTFFVPAEMQGQKVYLEFEGVYHKASIYLNHQKLLFHHNGYIGFYVEVTDHLHYGSDNLLRVDVVNSDQPNSRWYSGTGIYRPVWMHIFPEKHIFPEQLRVTTLDYRNPRIRIEAETTGNGHFSIQILDQDHRCIAVREGETDGKIQQELELSDALLWNPETPVLYTCRVQYEEDIQEVSFGIRMIECTPQRGFCINGKRMILRGACIHHDNGILGACAYDYAERRKVRLLKEAGYNAIRSAHNPCSKSMLRACDEQGMLVMDEYTDMWYIHKNKYDYATEVTGRYREDLKAIADRDYNHPSVVLYSTGNEVAETGQKRGIALCKEMTEWLHQQDPTRPVTCGVNIFFNFLSSMGFGVYSDKKAEQSAGNGKKKKAVGSEFYNILAGKCGAGFMKFGATLYPCDVKTRDAYANMDMAGYNYGINRYRHDLKKYPKRLILGTETFCSDAYAFWEIAKKNPRIIGDFVWAGMDYLGEVGVGSWEYKDYAPDYSHGPGWVSAGSGRIDLIGKPLAEMGYTRVAFEQEDICVGVVPVNHTRDSHSPSAWKMSNALESWSWNGQEGQPARVEVYTRAYQVSLYVNDRCVGTKKVKNDCRVSFDTIYQDGSLRAAARNEAGEIIAEKVLQTAGVETILEAKPEQAVISADTDLCYVRLRYTDQAGEGKPLARGRIRLKVTGGSLLALGNACPYNSDGYRNSWTDTYYGEALAVIRPAGKGKILVEAESPYGNASTEVIVK